VGIPLARFGLGAPCAYSLRVAGGLYAAAGLT
jgi:hypothetical protein